SIFPNRKPVSRSWILPSLISTSNRRNLWKGAVSRTIPEDFLGRQIDCYLTVHGILNRRFVTLSGPGGVGKTLLLICVERYLNERAFFRDGVVHVDLLGASTAIRVLTILDQCMNGIVEEIHPHTSSPSKI